MLLAVYEYAEQWGMNHSFKDIQAIVNSHPASIDWSEELDRDLINLLDTHDMHIEELDSNLFNPDYPVLSPEEEDKILDILDSMESKLWGI